MTYKLNLYLDVDGRTSAPHRKVFYTNFLMYCSGKYGTVTFPRIVENILKNKYNASWRNWSPHIIFQSEEDAIAFVLEWS